MNTVNAYLSFNGTCESAFNFYKSVFGGDFSYIGKYKDMPDMPVPDEQKELIMHISLPIGNGTEIYGADALEPIVSGTNFSLSVNAESEAEAVRIFDALTSGGTIDMPMENTFWGALFGMCTDRFGVHWMVSFEHKTQA